VDPELCARWQQQALTQTWEPALKHPWILDMDMTVKPIFGHQAGAEIGYNPHKPGRPSHTLHTWFVRGLRLVLDVEVRSGKQHAAKHGQSRLWALWESLAPECRPWLACGDAGYGQEALMAECERRGQNYLFRQRQTRKVQQLIQLLLLTTTTRWRKTSRGWEGAEGQLCLQGWSQRRRVVVLRRLRERADAKPMVLAESTSPALPWTEVVASLPEYEYLVLVTNLPTDLVGLTDLYLQRADAENGYDELKNQWGWGPGLQLVEFVCPLCRAKAATGSHYQPPVVALRSRTSERIGQSVEGPDNQFAPSRHGHSEVIDWVEPVFEWAAQYCGAVEPGAALGADLDSDFGADPALQGSALGAERVSRGWDSSIIPPQD
jgi:hypothetical protein